MTTKATVDNAESIARKVSRTAAACKTLGRWGFWGQLILFTVAAVVVVFSFLFKGFTKATDAGLYFILFGIMAGFFTTFWSLGLVRLGDRLKASIADLDWAAESGGGESVDDWVDGEFGWVRRHDCWFTSDDGVVIREDVDDRGDWAIRAKCQSGVGVGYFLGSSGEQRDVGALVGDEYISLWLLRTVNLPSPPAPKGEK